MARIADTRYAMDDDAFWFEGVAGRAGRHYIEGTTGDDRLRGTDGGDNFHVEFGNGGDGGTDFLRGLAGNDHFFFGATYTDADYVDGGDGKDRVILEGSLDKQIVLGPDNFRDVESVKLLSGFAGADYNITLLDGLSDMRVRGGLAVDSLILDACALTTGAVKVLGGSLSDTIMGGSADDWIRGYSSADYLFGGAGDDRFIYNFSAESDRGHADTIGDFSSGDRISLEIMGASNLYHIGKTTGHAGDVVLHYDADASQTEITVFVDGDDTPDMLIFLAGNHQDLIIAHDNQIMIG